MSPTGAPLLHVHVKATGIDEKLVVLLARSLAFGRGGTCDVELPSATVSRCHVSVHARGGRLVVRDHSSNGTRIDGHRLHLGVREVGSRAELQVGPYAIVLALDGEANGRDAPRARTTRWEPGNLRGASSSACAVALQARDRAAGSSGSPSAALAQDAREPEAKQSLHSASDQLAAAAAYELDAALAGAVTEDTDDAPTQLPENVVEAVVDDHVVAALPQADPLGPSALADLLRDHEVRRVMVVDAATLYLERAGVVERSPARFADEAGVLAALQYLLAPLGLSIDPAMPVVDASLTDGTRLHAVLPPMARKGTCITLVKRSAERATLEHWVERGSLSEPMARWLSQAVHARTNVFVAGSSRASNTMLLEALCASIAEHERIITIEDAAELSLSQAHVVSLVTRPADLHGEGGFDAAALLQHALRMRPDRILLHPCRGAAAFELVQALNAGRAGALTTIHASSPADALKRLEAACLVACPALAPAAVRGQIAAGAQLLVQLTDGDDGRPCVTQVHEVVGLDARGEIVLHELFAFVRSAGGDRRVPGEPLADAASSHGEPRIVRTEPGERAPCF
jgi:pilus assembly protein CpaF